MCLLAVPRIPHHHITTRPSFRLHASSLITLAVQALERDRGMLQWEWEQFKQDRARFDAEVAASRRERKLVITIPCLTPACALVQAACLAQWTCVFHTMRVNTFTAGWLTLLAGAGRFLRTVTLPPPRPAPPPACVCLRWIPTTSQADRPGRRGHECALPLHCARPPGAASTGAWALLILPASE